MLRFSPLKVFFIFLACAVFLIYSVPNFVPKEKRDEFPYSLFPSQSVNLGLDLRGGAHLLLQVDFDYYLKEQFTNLSDELKRSFIEEGLSSVVKVSSESITFDFSQEESIPQAKKLAKKLDREIEFDVDDNQMILSYPTSKIVTMKRDLVAQSIEIIRRRVDETGTKEPIIQAQGKSRVLLQVPGAENPGEIKDLLGKTAKLTFHFVVDVLGDDEFMGYDSETTTMSDVDGRNFLIKKKPMLTGDLLVDANATFYENEPAVGFKFNYLGARKFAEITSNNVGRLFAIVLDGKIITAPKINSVISGGAGVISGSFTTPEANELSLLLRAGALPAPISILEERTVGPSLGSDSIKAGTTAAIYSFVLVAFFMVFFYGYFGVVASFALVINIAMVLTFLAMLGATLTLPGIAGIILTIGMSVDANVLIFERIKEEVRARGRKVITAVDAGFHGAFRTIIDSNLTTLIIAILLYLFGSGPIRGFAVTLTFGIISSMFTAIVLTRTIIILWIKLRKTPPQHLPI
ncbi:MAG: protein-export membrane protein SecD [Lentimonas sp.]|jgi:protein-export membrane protein SecD